MSARMDRVGSCVKRQGSGVVTLRGGALFMMTGAVPHFGSDNASNSSIERLMISNSQYLPLNLYSFVVRRRGNWPRRARRMSVGTSPG